TTEVPLGAAFPQDGDKNGGRDQVTIDVEDAPLGLVAAVDGTDPQPPPFLLLKGSGTHQVRFDAPGYRSRTLRLDSNKDLALVLSLRPARSARPAARRSVAPAAGAAAP